MADLTFFQKYPKADEDQSGAKSVRLDHPDFADVLRTNFAKGIITDFELAKNEDGSDKTDPLTVISKVKVRIGDEEYPDFIPLFFHPKVLYWDGPDEILATDFNAEGKYFEKAWMSFRCGDEVVVLMRATESEPELKPFAVIGFADGVPRIGENIINLVAEGSKLHDEYDYCVKCSPPVTYYGDDETAGNDAVGPDGIDLKLLQESTVILYETGVPTRAEKLSGGIVFGAVQYTEIDNGPPGEQSIIHIANHYVDPDYVCDEFYIKSWLKWDMPPTVRVKEYLVKVGPIAYLIQVLSVYYSRMYDWYYNEYTGCGHVDYFYNLGLWWSAAGGTTYPDSQVVTGASGDLEAALVRWDTLDVRVKAAIYKPEMEEMEPTTHIIPTAALALHNDNEDWTNQYDDFVSQVTLRSLLWSRIDTAEFENMEYAQTTNGFNWLTATFNTRPHLKEELIVAEMWPKEEEA